jgi:hypothetical protein
MICGPKIANGVYRRRYNDELDKEFDSLNTLNITKTSRLLVTWSEDPKTYHKKLYSELNSIEREIKKDRIPDGRMGWTAIAWPERSSSTGLNQILVVVQHKKVSK